MDTVASSIQMIVMPLVLAIGESSATARIGVMSISVTRSPCTTARDASAINGIRYCRGNAALTLPWCQSASSRTSYGSRTAPPAMVSTAIVLSSQSLSIHLAQLLRIQPGKIPLCEFVVHDGAGHPMAVLDPLDVISATVPDHRIGVIAEKSLRALRRLDDAHTGKRRSPGRCLRYDRLGDPALIPGNQKQRIEL